MSHCGSNHREKRNSPGSDLHSHKTKPNFTGIRGIYMEENKSRRRQLAKQRLPNAGLEVSNLQWRGGTLMEGPSYSFPPAPPAPIWTVCSLAWVILSQTFFNFSPGMTPIFPGSHVFILWFLFLFWWAHLQKCLWLRFLKFSIYPKSQFRSLMPSVPQGFDCLLFSIVSFFFLPHSAIIKFKMIGLNMSFLFFIFYAGHSAWHLIWKLISIDSGKCPFGFSFRTNRCQLSMELFSRICPERVLSLT